MIRTVFTLPFTVTAYIMRQIISHRQPAESFKNMKGGLGLRPNFHHRDIPTIAHVHATVLAWDIKKVKNIGDLL